MKRCRSGSKEGYVLVYCLIAISLGLITVLGIVKTAGYFAIQSDKAIGEQGAYLSCTNAESLVGNYIETQYKASGSAEGVVNYTRDLLLQSANNGGISGGDLKSKLFIEGFNNQSYKRVQDYYVQEGTDTKLFGDVNELVRDSSDTICSGCKVFVLTSCIDKVSITRKLDCVVVGEYSIKNKVYSKVMTVSYELRTKNGILMAVPIKIVDGIEGGMKTWGNVHW